MAKLTILSGRSGSGKTTALQALEDHGYYCVDNLPLGLLPTRTEQLDTEEHAPERVAVGVDARNLPRQLLAFKSIIKALKNQQVETEVIFLDADPGTLLERFSATRRRHPLSDDDRTLADAIEYEAHLLADIRMLADLVIDTSNLTAGELRALIDGHFRRADTLGLTVTVISFSYRLGLPREADLVFDVRFLANPRWVDGLRPLTGNDPAVGAYVGADPECEPFLESFGQMLQTPVPLYIKEGNAI